MIKKTALLLLLLTTLCACNNHITGGPCSYTDYPGTCTGQADGKFTYKGTVDGKEIELKDNGPGPATLTEGQSQSCNLKYINKGSCIPCAFNIGECGKEAFDVIPSNP